MKTFSEFLNEIALNADMVPPRRPPSLRSSGGLAPSGDSGAVIPFVLSPRAISMLDELGDAIPEGHAAAMKVLGRLASQPRDGSPVVTYISNLEADSLRSLAREMISDSDGIMGSSMHHSTKDDAFRRVSFANVVLKGVSDGENTASRGKITR